MKEKEYYTPEEVEAYLETNSALNVNENVDDDDKTYWRYQMVYTEKDGVKEYGIIEVYCDSENRLEMWTVEMVQPYGSNFAGLNGSEELINDLERMLVDAKSWEAVCFDTLTVGMSFTQMTK